jgi:hypothetical protein
MFLNTLSENSSKRYISPQLLEKYYFTSINIICICFLSPNTRDSSYTSMLRFSELPSISKTRKVKLSLYRHAVDKGERSYSSYSFLTSALDEVSCQRHISAVLCRRGIDPDTHSIGCWVGPRAGWTQRIEEKSFRLCRGSNRGGPVVQSVVRHYTV